MIICFDCSSEAKAALDRLIATGKFRDMPEAISMALVNYEVIHRAMQEGRGFTHSGAVLLEEAKSATSISKPEPKSDQQVAAPLSVPNMFQRPPEQFDASRFPAPSSPDKPSSLSPKDWLWGQYNRFLPVKATCRALFNLSHEKDATRSVDELSKKISFEACLLGDGLAASDKTANRTREETLAAAFPNTGWNGGQSRSRFQTQFVAAINKLGKLTGMPADLRLVCLEEQKQECLTLTSAGAQFAALSNPVLDGAAGKWAAEEIRFLLDHITRYVPVELHAYLTIIAGIEAGANTPDTLDAFLREQFNLKTEADIKQTFLSTQRTGAVSRMAELDLLWRQKSGIRVTYGVSHPGKLFAHQAARNK